MIWLILFAFRLINAQPYFFNYQFDPAGNYNHFDAENECYHHFHSGLATIESEQDLQKLPIPRINELDGNLNDNNGMGFIGVKFNGAEWKYYQHGVFGQSLSPYLAGLVDESLWNGQDACMAINVHHQLVPVSCDTPIPFICDGPVFEDCVALGNPLAPEIDRTLPENQCPMGDLTSRQDCGEWCGMCIPDKCAGYSWDNVNAECHGWADFDYNLLDGQANFESGAMLCRANVRDENVCVNSKGSQFPHSDIREFDGGSVMYQGAGYNYLGYPQYRTSQDYNNGELFMQYKDDIPYKFAQDNPWDSPLMDNPSQDSKGYIIHYDTQGNGAIDGPVLAYCIFGENTKVDDFFHYCRHSWYVEDEGNYRRDNEMDIYRCSNNGGGGDGSGGCSNDCQCKAMECFNHETCEPIVAEYFDKCGAVFGMNDQLWTEDYCPPDCANALSAYLPIVGGWCASLDSVCDCGEDAGCIDAKVRLVDIGCFTPPQLQPLQQGECYVYRAGMGPLMTEVCIGNIDGKWQKIRCTQMNQATTYVFDSEDDCNNDNAGQVTSIDNDRTCGCFHVPCDSYNEINFTPFFDDICTQPMAEFPPNAEDNGLKFKVVPFVTDQCIPDTDNYKYTYNLVQCNGIFSFGDYNDDICTIWELNEDGEPDNQVIPPNICIEDHNQRDYDECVANNNGDTSRCDLPWHIKIEYNCGDAITQPPIDTTIGTEATTGEECLLKDTFTFDWDDITRYGDTRETDPDVGRQIPAYSYDLNIEEADLSLNIDVTVEYVVLTSADDQVQPRFGTTFVFDFEDFDAHESKIYEPGTCQNRFGGDFVGLSFDQRWDYSLNPNDIGTTNNIQYPPVQFTNWNIMDANCLYVHYKGKFTWDDLRNCKNFNEDKQYTFIDDTDPNYLQLTGTFYINVVSPFWYKEYPNMEDYYRVYQLLSYPFVIRVSRSVYVIGSTDVNVMTMSIIAVYKEDQDNDYVLILLTETAEYMQLITPQKIAWPSNAAQYNLELQPFAETADCLNNKQYLCSQLWKIYASDTHCTQNADEGGGIDFSGDYYLRFTPTCRQGTGEGGYDFSNHCNDWLNAHDTIKQGVELDTTLYFIDEICAAETFTIQLHANMNFYEDPNYATQINDESQFLYEVGKGIVYGEITLKFPSNTESIFDSALVNVWLCTFPPFAVVAPPDQHGPNAAQDNGGCFSPSRDGFNNDNFFFHIYDAADPAQHPQSFQIIENGDEGFDRIRFSFVVPHEIQRDTIYVHAQVSVLLEELTDRRRVLLDVDATRKSNKMSHFGREVGVMRDNKKKEPQPQPYEHEPEYPQEPQFPIQQPQPPSNGPFTIDLYSPYVWVIGGVLAVILGFNVVVMCYVNGIGSRNRGRVSFNKNRRNGYASVKYGDSEDCDQSEMDQINVD